jgi:hypothetical protein
MSRAMAAWKASFWFHVALRQRPQLPMSQESMIHVEKSSS